MVASCHRKYPKLSSSPTVQSNLVSNLDGLHWWYVRNKLPLNMRECYSYAVQKNHSLTPVYYLDGEPFAMIASNKDLDATFESKFRFNSHYVYRRIQRSFGPHFSYQFTDIHFLVTIYNSFVCNILECAPIVWSSYHISDCPGFNKGQGLLGSLSLKPLEPFLS